MTNRSGAPPLQGVHFLLLPCILRSGVFYETSAATNNLSSDSHSLFSNKTHNLHKNQFNIGRSFYSPRPSVVNNLDRQKLIPNFWQVTSPFLLRLQNVAAFPSQHTFLDMWKHRVKLAFKSLMRYLLQSILSIVKRSR